MQKAKTKNLYVIKAQGETAIAGPLTMRKRIGSTVYEVNVYFNPDAKETINDKILRLIKNDLHPAASDATIGLPQTGWLPEGSSA
ncbi:MAG: transposon-encoded TnpW family protein [Clostridiales bacterium]|nr:transposon-encoded TnpW family protein [Clostridiales bacterium]